MGVERLEQCYLRSLAAVKATGIISKKIFTKMTALRDMELLVLFSELQDQLLVERSAFLNFAEAGVFDVVIHMEKNMICPVCGGDDYRDMGHHPYKERTANILLCRGCGAYVVKETTFVVVTDQALLSKLLVNDKDFKTAP